MVIIEITPDLRARPGRSWSSIPNDKMNVYANTNAPEQKAIVATETPKPKRREKILTTE